MWRSSKQKGFQKEKGISSAGLNHQISYWVKSGIIMPIKE
jgi:hypothetical protein